MGSIHEEDNEEATAPNQLLLDALTARFTAVLDQRLDQRFETFRDELVNSDQGRSRRSRNHSETENYYSHSSRSNGARRRRHDNEERRPRPTDPISSLKLKIPEFKGTSNPEEYLEWEKKLEIVFECKEYTQDQKLKLAPTEFKDYALSWWDNLITSRRRVGDFPIESWNQLKLIMRKRFIPSHYYRELHFKLRTLSQGSRTVDEYYKELETLMMRADVREDNEATMARFLGGLNRDIQDKLEVQHYVEMEELLHKAIMFEKQLKRRTYKSSSGVSKPSYQKDEKSGSYKEFKPFPKPRIENQNLKDKDKPTTSHTRDIQCFKCKGFGHYSRDCINKRSMIIRDNGDIESEDEQTGSEPIEEQFEPPISGELLVTRRTLNLKTKADENDQRENLFHTRCLVKDKVCSMVIDGGSCTNVASESMVEKLGLTIQKRAKPYKLQWLNDEGELEVENQVLVPFSIGRYEDQILCDVLPMDAGHILLGRPWQSDRKVLHDGYTNRYSFDYKGKKTVLTPLSPQEVYQDQLSLKKSREQAKSSSKQPAKNLFIKPKGSSFAHLLLMFKDCFHLNEPLQAMPSILKLLLQEFSDVFTEEHSQELPPIRGIEHQIDFVPGSSLPNRPTYRTNPEETKELRA